MKMKPLRILWNWKVGGVRNWTLILLTFTLLYSNQIANCGEKSEKAETVERPLFDTTSYFDFAPVQPVNKYGIFATTIVQIEYLGNEELFLWRTNSKFVDEVILSSFQELCGLSRTRIFSENKGDFLTWGNCTFNDNQITAYITEGNTDPWNRNFTYIEIKTKQYVAGIKGVRHVCVLNEFPGRKAYVVLATYSINEEDGTVSEPIYKLDMFLPMALSFFEDIIDFDKILQFSPLDFFNPTKHYKCMVGIASGQPIEKLKKVCKFKCAPREKEGSGGGKDKIRKVDKKKIHSGKNSNSSQLKDEL